MLECPDCGRGFELSYGQYVKYLILGDIFCQQCSTCCHVASRRGRRARSLPVLRILILSSLFLCFAYLVVHMLLVFINPWLLLDVPRNRFFMIATCASAVVLASAILCVGYLILRSLLGSLQYKLVSPLSKLGRDCCPVCAGEAVHGAIPFGDTLVCPECTSEYAQRLREGIA